jgi:5,6-dimethylbenzimidazole synthase
MSKLSYNESDRKAVYRAIAERRDMRHFLPDPVAPEVMQRLLEAAHCAPSVGYMQPWRFIRVSDAVLRNEIYNIVEEERINTAKALGEREDEFMRLKVEGVLDCSELLVVALMDNREPHIFGRRTMPNMDLASAACAIQNLWLAARTEGLGVGWVSIFCPEKLAALLNMPAGSDPIAILCVGHVEAFYPEPMLAMENWTAKTPLDVLIMENGWQEKHKRNL